ALQSLSRAQLPDGSAAAAVQLRIAAQRAALYERSNQLERARAALQHVPLDRLEQLPPDADETRAEAWSAHAAIAMRDADHAGAAAHYRRTLALALDEQHRAAAAFGLAAASDRLGRHSEAWQALQTAHTAQLAIAQDVVPELMQPHSRPLAMAAQRVDRTAFQSWAPLPAPADAHSPIFVVGF